MEFTPNTGGATRGACYSCAFGPMLPLPATHFFPGQHAFAENREKEMSKPHRFSMNKLLTLFDEGGNPGHQVQFDLVVKFIRLEIDTST